jgi:hypothetical protein
MRRMYAAIFIATLITLSSCELIGDIFKAGMWTGIIAVVAIVALIIFVLGKIMGGRK